MKSSRRSITTYQKISDHWTEEDVLMRPEVRVACTATYFLIFIFAIKTNYRMAHQCTIVVQWVHPGATGRLSTCRIKFSSQETAASLRQCSTLIITQGFCTLSELQEVGAQGVAAANQSESDCSEFLTEHGRFMQDETTRFFLHTT